ncbi:tetratricopeptide repeat protein [bacterium]|nr:tetratricopeptide repeat protein [bacterium]
MKRLFLLSLYVLVVTVVASFSQDIATAREEIFFLEDFESAGGSSSVKPQQGIWQEGSVSGSASNYRAWRIPEVRFLKRTTVLRLACHGHSTDFKTGGYFFKFEKTDLSKFNNLNFYVKGDRWDGFPDDFEIQLQAEGYLASRGISGITTSWQKITVPLASFKQVAGGSKEIDSLRIIFDASSPGSKEGVIYIDDIFFSADLSAQQSVDDYINKGNSYCDLDEYEAGVKEYKQALKLDPNNVYARTNLGLTYLKQQKYCDAVNELEKVIEIDPVYAFAHLSLAIIYEDYFFEDKKAVIHYDKFLEMDKSLDAETRERLKQWVKGIKQEHDRINLESYNNVWEDYTRNRDRYDYQNKAIE